VEVHGVDPHPDHRVDQGGLEEAGYGLVRLTGGTRLTATGAHSTMTTLRGDGVGYRTWLARLPYRSPMGSPSTPTGMRRQPWVAAAALSSNPTRVPRRWAISSATPSPVASTMTLTNGSVPLGRSSTRPASPSRSSSSATADHTACAPSNNSVLGHGDVDQHLGDPVDQAVQQIGQRRVGPLDQVGEDQAGEQPVPRGGQSTEDDVARLLAPRASPSLSRAASTKRSPTVVSLTKMPASPWPGGTRDWSSR